MKNKITLITPPDYFENSSSSILLVDINEKDQETITDWLGVNESDKDLNLYYYNGDNDAKWLLTSLSKATMVFIDIDDLSDETSLLLGYILSKPNVYYKTLNEISSNTLKYINSNRLPDVRYFLDEIVKSHLDE